MEKSQDNFFSSLIKGIFLSVIVALVLVLLFALIIKFLMPSSTVIKVVNQFIKIVAIFIGCFTSLKNNLGLLKGGLIGLGFCLLISLIFMIFGGNLSYGLAFILDLILCVIVGIISGVLSVNVKGKE